MADQITADDQEMAQMLNANAIGSKEGEQRSLRSKAPDQDPVGPAKKQGQQDAGVSLKKRGRGRPRKNGTEFAPKQLAKNIFDVPDDVTDKDAKAVGNRKKTQTIDAKLAKNTATNKRKTAAEIDGSSDPIETSLSKRQRKVHHTEDENDKEVAVNVGVSEIEHTATEFDSVLSTPTESSNTAGELQLFGRERGWTIVLEGAQNVGISVQKGKKVSEKPNLQTNTVTELLRNIKEAIALYKSLRSPELLEPEDIKREKERRLIAMIEQIYETVDGVSESGSGANKSQMIQDIYAYAIPSMVFLLEAAMKCRNDQYSQSSDVPALQEVIKIQDMILDLCQKARQWKAKPITDRPITGSTSQKIGPYMRDLRKAFGNELERRERSAQQQSYDQKLAESHRRQTQLRERQKALNARKAAEQRTRHMEELRRKPPPWRSHATIPSPYQNEAPMAQMMPPAPNSQIDLASEPAPWTPAENVELIMLLTRREIRYLPAYQRYLAMLESPLLCGKDPEQIRERALYYKDTMIAEAGPLDYILSIE